MDIGGKAVIVEFERKRVKNINVRVRRDGSLYASMPYWVSYAEAERFIQSKTSFFIKAIDDVSQRSDEEDKWKNIDKETQERLKNLILELIELHMPFFRARGIANPSKIVIGHYRSFWGECLNKRGILKFSTRLAEKTGNWSNTWLCMNCPISLFPTTPQPSGISLEAFFPIIRSEEKLSTEKVQKDKK